MITKISRRKFMQAAASVAVFCIVPRNVLGGKEFTPPSDIINLAFIGTGKQSYGLMKNFFASGETRIVAACDVYEAKLNAFVTQWKVLNDGNKIKRRDSCKGYQDYRKVLKKSNVDAVVIATPDHWHGVIAVEAANAGKDIYCEKPLSLTIKEGRAMVEATRKNNTVFQPAVCKGHGLNSDNVLN